MKRILCAVTALFIAVSPIQAQQVHDRVAYVVPSAEKGLNSHISPYLTPENAAVEATNVRVNNQFGSVASRDILVSEIDMGTGSVNGLWRYYISDANKYTVAAIGTYLKYDASGTATTLTQGLTDGKRFQFVTYKDIMIAGNGYDQPVKWDGLILTTADTTATRTAGDLCAQLGAPFAQRLTGANLDASSWYQYKVAYYDGTTYSYSTARSNPIETGAAVRDVRLTDIPIGPTGTTHRYVYRTLGNATRVAVLADTTFYLVATIADNSTQTVDDAMTDDDADDDDAPTWATVSAGNNATPPKASIIEICNERLFASGVSTAGYQSDVYWSDDGNPDYFTPSAIIMVRPDDGDRVTFLKTFLGILTIGKTNTIQKFYTEGSPLTDWSLSNPFSFVGCPAAYTAAVTPLGIFYLGRAGLYRFTGQASELISDAVTKEINDMSQIAIADCAGIYWNNEYHLAYASEASSSATNNRVLVYDTIRNAYVVDTKNVNCFAAFNSGSDYGTLYSGTSTTDGYVFANSTTTYTFLKRYMSELDLGTYSKTDTTGTEEYPILSMYVIDNMETYTTDELARASWISSEITAAMMVPSELGTGLDGAVTISADETLTESEYNYLSLTIDAGKQVIAGKGTTINCLGTVTINGTLYCGGDLTINCHTLIIGAAGILGGKLTVNANLITNGGLITGDATRCGDGWSQVMFDGSYAASITGSQSNTFIALSDIIWVSSKVGCASTGENQTSNGLAYVGGATINSANSADGRITGNNGTTVSQAWNIPSASNASGNGTSWNGAASGYVYEIQAYMGTPVLNYADTVNTTLGTIDETAGARPASDTSAFVYALDVFSEAGETNQGEYALKIVVPGGADTLDEQVAKAITGVNLSGYNSIMVDAYALRTGTNMQFGIYDSGAGWTYYDMAITASNTWEVKTVDISVTDAADRDDVTSVAIKFTDTDSGNVVIIDNIRPATTSGTWTSPIYDINAETLKKLYWNENLNTYGDVTWAIRTNSLNLMNGVTSAAATADAGASIIYTTSVAHGLTIGDLITIAGYSGGNAGYNGDFTVTDVSDSTHFKVTCAFVGDAAGTWALRWTATEYTNPNGSDISAENAERYIQFRATLTTTDTTTYLYPWLYQTDGYVFKINYSKIGANYETSVSNVWKTGWRNLGRPGNKKMIKRVQVYYEGEAETFTVNILGDDANVDQTFTVDMSILPDTDITDRYTGTNAHKIYTWEPPINTESEQSLISEFFQFTVTHEGDEFFRINQIKVYVNDEPIY